MELMMASTRLICFSSTLSAAFCRPENAPDDAVGVERFERIVFFADADELDGLPGNLADGEGRAAARVAVHFGKDDTSERELLMELVSRFDGVLSGHRVSNK